MKTIYIASGEKEKGAILTEFLRNKGVLTINPWEHQVENIFNNDLELIDKSNLVAVIMPIGGYAYGVVCESMYAYQRKIPVYTLTNASYGEPLFMKRVSRKIFWSPEEFREELVVIGAN